MAYINRGCIIIRVATPYIDWARSLDDSGMIPNPETDEPTVYLIADYDVEEEAWEALEEKYEIIFEEELEAWHTDDTDWPENRTFELFKEWFTISFCSGVQDFGGDEIIYEEDA